MVINIVRRKISVIIMREVCQVNSYASSLAVCTRSLPTLYMDDIKSVGHMLLLTEHINYVCDY